jgi:hypothetical protein
MRQRKRQLRKLKVSEQNNKTIRPSIYRHERWTNIKLPFAGQVALGNGSQFYLVIQQVSDSQLFLGIEGKGGYRFNHYVHYDYVIEKVGLMIADAKNIADIINYILPLINNDNVEYISEQGSYYDEFCL